MPVHRPTRSLRTRPGERPRRSPSRRPAPPVIPYVVFGLAVVYGLALGIFALTHYDDGERPGTGQVIRDFHARIGLGPSPARAEAVPEMPVRKARPPVPRPGPVVARREPSRLDRVARTLKKVEREAPGLRKLGRGLDFEEARVRLLNDLTEARDALGAILDADPENDRANGLWDDLQYLLAAVRKY